MSDIAPVACDEPTRVRLVTVPQAARMLNVGNNFCWNLVTTGRLRSIKLGDLRRVPVEAIDEFIAATEAAQ